MRDLFHIYELFFILRSTQENTYALVFKDPFMLNTFASLLFYEKLNYFLLLPQISKVFLNFSECILKIRLTTSNFFFTALDGVSYKTLLTGTGGMLHVPLVRQPYRLLRQGFKQHKKLAKRQDIKYKKSSKNQTKKLTQPRSKKFARKNLQSTVIKKKRPKWIQKTSFVSLFYLCDKFFRALKDFGYLQLRF